MTPSNRTLPLLAAANFSAACAGMIIAGILQLVASDLGWSTREAGRLITTYALGFAVGAPVLGAALGTWCRKRVVLLGLGLVAVGSVASALSTRSPWLELSRLVVAAGAAMTIPSVSAIAAYLFPSDRPRALAFVLAGTTIALLLGVPIGTFVAGLWGWHAPLFGVGVLAVVTALAIKRLLPGGIVVPPVPLSTWRELLGKGRTYPLLGLSMLVVAATFCLYGYIAPFLQAMLGFGPRELSWLLFWFGLASLAASGLLARISRRVAPGRLLVVSLVGLALTLAATRFTENRAWLVAILFAAWAMFSSFFGTLQQARVVDAAPSASTAMLALNTSAAFGGQAMGTLVGGAVLAVGGVRALPWTGAALALAALVLHATSSRSSSAAPRGEKGRTIET